MRYYILISSMILVLAATASGETYVVNPEGTGDFPTIQAAIDAVVDGDIIELTDGTFTGDGNRDIDYLGKAITVRSQSGDPDSCIIDCEGSAAEQHRGFTFHSGEEPSSVLEGVTITNGYGIMGDGPYGANCAAGGVLCSELSSPTITDCVFLANSGGTSPYDYGGGMYCKESSCPTLTGCRFLDNTARSGAGVGCEFASPMLVECVFEGNIATQHGGGMDCRSGPGACLIRCTFSDNTANTGGGMSCSGNSAQLTDCNFSDNSASFGGGLSFEGGYPTLSSCRFKGTSSSLGGGVYCRNSFPTITDCMFLDNTAAYANSGLGGGMYFRDGSSPTLTRCTFSGNYTDRHGGGIYSTLSSTPNLIDCSFSGNEARTDGGGIACASTSATFTRCTFVENSAEWGGGAVCRSTGLLTLQNCTFYRNAAVWGAGVYGWEQGAAVLENTIIAFSTEGVAVLVEEAATATLTCCDIYGNAGGDWVGCIADQYGIRGNICEDPLFCGPGGGDFTLQDISPCAPFSPPNPACDLIGAWPVGCGQNIEEREALPVHLYLSPGSPNPFCQAIEITYAIRSGLSSDLSRFSASSRHAGVRY